MKGKNLIILGVVAAALIATAVITSRDKSNQETREVMGQQVFPELPVNDIVKIVVKKGASTLTLTRHEDQWICPDKYNYPVKFDRIKQTILQLADLKIGQKMMVNDLQLSRMGMGGAGSDNPATVMELLAEGDVVKARLMIGGTRQNMPQDDMQGGYGRYPEGTFISSNMGETVYLVKDSFYNITEEAKGWLVTELLDVSPTDVRKITINNAGSKPLVLVKKENDELTLEGLTDTEECDTSVISSMKSALSSLHLDNVADPSLTDQELGMDKAVVYQAETVKGEVYTVSIGSAPKANASKYVRISVALKPLENKADNEEKTALTDEEKKAAEEKVKTAATERAELEKKVKELNDELSKWTYMVALYKTDNMACTRESIVKLKKNKEEKPSE